MDKFKRFCRQIEQAHRIAQQKNNVTSNDDKEAFKAFRQLKFHATGLAKKQSMGTQKRMRARVGSGPIIQSKSIDQRRVMVKARFHKHNQAESLIRHLRYLQREEVNVLAQAPDFFDADNEAACSKNFATSCESDRHHFRFILSPEDGKELDLKRLTRELIERMERDLDTKLQWVAVEHRNTDNPHVHLLIRGKRDNKQDLVINKHYMSYGIRTQVQTLATYELGIRSEREIQRGLSKSLEQKRVLPIDKIIDSHLNQQRFNIELTSLSKQEKEHINIRMKTLTRLGLAKPDPKIRATTQIHPDFLNRLSVSFRQAIKKYKFSEKK